MRGLPAAAFALSLAVLLCLSASAAVEPGEEIFAALRAVRVSDTEVVVEFSKPLDERNLSRPYVALRLCNVEEGKCAGMIWENGQPLQESATSKSKRYKDDPQRARIVFDKGVLDEMLSKDSDYYKRGARVYLCIEEMNAPEGHNHQTLYDVISADGMLLRSACPPTTGWDGVYLPIEVDYDYKLTPLAGVTEPPIETDPWQMITFPLPTSPADSGGQEGGGEGGCAGCMAMQWAAPLLALGMWKSRKRK